MAESDAERIAAEIVRQLGGSVVSSALPAWAGEWIRKASGNGTIQWVHMLPLAGPDAIRAEYRIAPDGVIMIELSDTFGATFWRGAFRPVEASDGGQ